MARIGQQTDFDYFVLHDKCEKLQGRLNDVKNDAAKVRTLLLKWGNGIPEPERTIMVDLLNNITR